jgi:hypothetical protein
MQGNNNGHKTTLERVWCCTLLKYCGRVCTPLRPAPPPPPPPRSSSSKRARSGPESLAQLLVHRLACLADLADRSSPIYLHGSVSSTPSERVQLLNYAGWVGHNPVDSVICGADRALWSRPPEQRQRQRQRQQHTRVRPSPAP